MGIAKINGVDVTTLSKWNGVDVSTISKINGVELDLASDNQYVLDAITYANANAITVPPAGYITALHKLFNTIQAYNGGSLLTNADIIRVYAYDGSANEFATINLARNAFHATIVNSPVFTAKKGVQPDGVNGYIDSNYQPSTNAINIDNDTLMTWGYFTDPLSTSTVPIVGVRGTNGGRIAISPYRNTTDFEVQALTTLNGEGIATTTGMNNNGSVGAITTTPGTITPYRNGVALTNLTGLTDGDLPNRPMYEAGYNNNGALMVTATNVKMAAFYIGAPDAAGQLVLHNAFTQYLTDIAGL